jgi:hypothetical protein
MFVVHFQSQLVISVLSDTKESRIIKSIVVREQSLKILGKELNYYTSP